MNPTPIDGLETHPLDIHADNRGWFKENWSGQRLRPVQNNISFNARVGATRGMHAEPWDKWVSVATGRVFAAWVDLREGSETFATKFGVEIGPDTAVFVPRGVANGFQALEDATTYTYLVNARYNPNGAYAYCSYREIDWPLEPTELSEADQKHPPLADAPTVPPRKILVTGANGQLGRALRKVYSEREAEFCTRAEFDITHPPARDWNEYRAIINCAAYNDVNGAETERGTAWAVNADAVAGLARIASEHDLTLVHVSSDYVFDGLNTEQHTEDELPSPLSAYGASKSAGETAARATPRHYVIRTSWVFGEGANFMDTMARLADKGVSPSVVADQRGRPTHADDLAHGIAHLLATKAEYGVYNITSDGDAVGRDEIAMSVFIGVGADPSDVTPVTTAQYAELNGPEAPRPKESTLSLDKIKATGFSPRNWRAALAIYLAAR
ncbi:dTDP-4-dehydrorhamnose reductase [Corynebacterium sanguinis]|uniref:dTDP-4-dehydrorhamnose reductase n=1 Tax=Corynebacterium sanguinis TaxID=2594913 RepID=UPI0021A61605|nr:dTDP-4-dehydrorhamnose reductase [Corynebacterium sanguinis]MCT1463355.1 dTDP-4-dehydrorhamnose reductase [Corynebacterium sanguinis]MCT2329999.1 dTDP-4-dehydrorhamnose reductase [Corynebacterium sanguinis]